MNTFLSLVRSRPITTREWESEQTCCLAEWPVAREEQPVTRSAQGEGIATIHHIFIYHIDKISFVQVLPPVISLFTLFICTNIYTHLQTNQVFTLQSKVEEFTEDLNNKNSLLESLKKNNSELDSKLNLRMQELKQLKDTLATNEEQFNQRLSTQTRLAELYKESEESTKKKANELEGSLKELSKQEERVRNERDQVCWAALISINLASFWSISISISIDLCICISISISIYRS